MTPALPSTPILAGSYARSILTTESAGDEADQSSSDTSTSEIDTDPDPDLEPAHYPDPDRTPRHTDLQLQQGAPFLKPTKGGTEKGGRKRFGFRMFGRSKKRLKGESDADESHEGEHFGGAGGSSSHDGEDLERMTEAVETDGDEGAHKTSNAEEGPDDDEASLSPSTVNTESTLSKSWEKVEYFTSPKRSVGGTLSKETAGGMPPVNLALEPWPPGNLHKYHDYAMREVIAGLVVTSIAVGALNYFRLSFFWSVMAIAIAAFAVRRRIEAIKDDFAYDVERKRGAKARRSHHPGESVEWMNEIVKTLWPLINSDLFVAGVDLLEDTLKAQAPAIVNTVRVEDIEQGSNPFRIVSLRILPEDEPICGELPAVPEEPGDYINLEVDFSFRRLPPPASKSANLHFLIYLGVGLKKLATVELPIWVELAGTHGKIRLRIQLTSEPPFFSNVTFTFPHLPVVDIVAKPLRSLNIMNIPLISSYILSSINTVLNAFVSPSSYTLDLSRLLLSSDVLTKSYHVGVLCLVVHFATDLKRADTSSLSDPYVTISFSRFGKPLYSTRVILKESNPSFEETAFIKVSPDSIAEAERVRLTVWDSDRFNPDDPLGMIEMPLRDIMQSSHKMHHKRNELQTVQKGSKVHGSLTWSYGYFPLIKTAPSDDMNKAVNIAGDDGQRPVFSGRGERQPDLSSPSAMYAERMREMLDAKVPLNQDRPSGILVYQINQITSLEVPSIRGAVGSRKTGDVLDKGAVPSSYCTVAINDQKVFQTRVKKMSASPYINAGGEYFVADWTRSRVDVAVLDARFREHDAVIGVVCLPLADVFSSRSQLTRWYPLVGGIGYGRIRISLLFKTVDISIPHALRTWNVGYLEITALEAVGLHEQVVGEIQVSTHSTSAAVTSRTSAAQPYEHDAKFSPDTYIMSWPVPTPIRLPILHRHQDVAIFALKTNHGLMPRHSVGGESFFWLSNMLDERVTDLELPIYGSEFHRLKYNNYQPQPNEISSIPKSRTRKSSKEVRDTKTHHPHHHHAASFNAFRPSNKRRGSSNDHHPIFPTLQHADAEYRHDPKNTTSHAHNKADAPIIGFLHVRARFVPGLHECHADVIESASSDFQEAYRTYKYAVDSRERQPDQPYPSELASLPMTSLNTVSSEFSAHSTSIRFPDLDYSESSSHTPTARHSPPGSRGPSSRRSSLRAGTAMSGALNGFTNTGDKHVSVIDEGSSEFEGSITPSRKDSWYGNWKDRRGSDAKSQAGANAVKPVRTFKWMADGAKKSMRKVSNVGKHKPREPDHQPDVDSGINSL